MKRCETVDFENFFTPTGIFEVHKPLNIRHVFHAGYWLSAVLINRIHTPGAYSMTSSNFLMPVSEL